MQDYQIQLEIIDNVEKQDEENSVKDTYNWMQENNSLLKNIDQSMLVNKKYRIIEISKMNITKDEHYYLLDGDKRIALQHGDILQLPQHRVRVSLLRPSQREESIVEYENVINKVIGYKSNEFNRVIHQEHEVTAEDRFLKPKKAIAVLQPHIDYKRKKNKVTQAHNLVPSTSAFSTPSYSNVSENVGHDMKRHMNPIKEQQEVIQKKSTIASAVRPLDQIDALYANSQQIKKTSQTHEFEDSSGKPMARVNKFMQRIINKTKEVI